MFFLPTCESNEYNRFMCMCKEEREKNCNCMLFIRAHISFSKKQDTMATIANNIESLKCPITGEIFQDPVIAQDGHTYERKAITEWLQRNASSPMTSEPMDISTLRTNHIVRKMIDECTTMFQLLHAQYKFELNIDIKKTRPRPIFQTFGKAMYEVEWINRKGPLIVLLKIDGAKASREASFYVQLSCHPHIVRTFRLVNNNPDSVMLLQECAPDGDLCELLRENQFKPEIPVLLEIFVQITDAMICLADNNIVHGDLACRNVLVFRSHPSQPKENLVKLTDFGLTRSSTLFSVVEIPASSTMNVVPVRYAAPEILRNTNRPTYSEKSDIYSIGVLMWEACSYGTLPYASLHNDDDVRKRKLNDERLPQPNICDNQLWALIGECWHQNPQDRPSFRSLKESLLALQFQLNSESKDLAASSKILRNLPR
jgi:serine/threonine protein kinase